MNPFRYGEAISAAYTDGYDTVVNVGLNRMASWIRTTARSMGRDINAVHGHRHR